LILGDFRLMAAVGPLFVVTKDGTEIKGRQRLQNTAAFDSMLADLTTRMEKHFQSNPEFVIADLDVSQNKLTLEQFQSLFLLLGTAGVRVLRFRMFGCATLTDEALKVISEYLRGLGADWGPSEMHLSDCAITAEGFGEFCKALEETNLFPRPVAPSAPTGYPLYLRMENNYIDEAVIREKVDAGLIQPFTKVGGARTVSIQGPKVNLLVKVLNSTYGQRTGPPPAPENAPPPKQVWDQNQQQSQAWSPQAAWMWQKGKGKGWGGCGWTPGMTGGRPPLAAALAGIAALAAPAGQSPVPMPAAPLRPRATMVQSSAPAAQTWPGQRGQHGQQSSWQSGSWQSGSSNSSSSWSGSGSWSNGSWGGNGGWWSNEASGWKDNSSWQSGSGTGNSWQKEEWPKRTPQQGEHKPAARQSNAIASSDRSRTPTARIIAPPTAVKNAETVPHPWEVHHSSEYQLDYYWNSETGESVWEKPEKW